MSEYIERGALLALFESAEEDDIELYGVHISDCFPAERASEIANTLPAADVEEVKHGRWIPLEYDGYADGNPVWDLWECSECQEEHSGDEDTLTPYCPNCGAKMDGGVK